jgi:hypothetical protein
VRIGLSKFLDDSQKKDFLLHFISEYLRPSQIQSEANVELNLFIVWEDMVYVRRRKMCPREEKCVHRTLGRLRSKSVASSHLLPNSSSLYVLICGQTALAAEFHRLVAMLFPVLRFQFCVCAKLAKRERQRERESSHSHPLVLLHKIQSSMALE